jgi:hypothetical protein
VPLRRQRDRALGAVPLSLVSPCFELTGDVLGEQDRMSDLVGVNDFWRQGVAAPVTDAAICVDNNPSHGAEKISGSDSTDRSAAV